MTKIAFLSYEWDYEIMFLYYQGMQAWLDEHEGVQLVIFNAFGEYESHGPEEGTFQVFSLCDYDEYDGFIIQGNRAWPPNMRQRVADQVFARNKPLVSISYELEGACYVGTNNYGAMYGLVEKVIREQGCTRPAFVNGLSTSLEAQERARGFADACARLRIPNAPIYEGSWEMQAGTDAALRILADPDNLPDVVFCCNDNLALGVQRTFQEHGLSVPGDVRISGFDNRSIAATATPRITTIDRDYRTVGYTALKVAFELVGRRSLMSHEATPMQYVSSPVQYVLTESCGYLARHETAYDAIARLSASHRELAHFCRVLRRFQPSVLDADTLPQIMQVCADYLHELGCDNVYLVTNEDYLQFDSPIPVTKYGMFSTLQVHCSADAAQATDTVESGSDRHETERREYGRFLTSRILPPDVCMDAPLYVVYPLRHDATCIGLLVTEGLSRFMEQGFLAIILKLISCAVENQRKKELLQNLNLRLDYLYVHDQLTGLFNRFGLYRYGRIAYEHLLRDFEAAQFIFVDIDGMKLINDVHGHEAGDMALKDVADIIGRATEDENAFAMRYGGDEFLLICRRNLIPKMEAELAALKAHAPRPFDLGLSMGLCEVTSADDFSLEEAIELADAKMYEIKKARKTARP